MLACRSYLNTLLCRGPYYRPLRCRSHSNNRNRIRRLHPHRRYKNTPLRAQAQGRRASLPWHRQRPRRPAPTGPGTPAGKRWSPFSPLNCRLGQTRSTSFVEMESENDSCDTALSVSDASTSACPLLSPRQVPGDIACRPHAANVYRPQGPNDTKGHPWYVSWHLAPDSDLVFKTVPLAQP